METRQGSALQSLRSVKVFLDTNAAKLDGVVKTGARQQLDDAIAELSAHVSDQSGNNLASQGATRKQRSLRVILLRDHMAPIARIARLDLPITPETEPLKMPKGRPTPERLAALAAGMGKAAAPFTSVFTSSGLPDDFVTQLDAAATAMLDALTDRTENRGKRGGATKGLKTKLGRGRRIVHVLDAFVKSALKDDSALLAEWNIIKRVRSAPRVVPSAAAPVTTVAPAQPVPPTPAPAPVETQTPAA